MTQDMATRSTSSLAVLGGMPVCSEPWPSWPCADENTLAMLKDVLYSDRWTITSPYTGRPSYERRFSEAFARFYDLPYCVPTASGSSALTIALEALQVGRGQEVLVPGISWVACAAIIVGIGAVPILVDIDPGSLCMSPEKARAAITPRSGAILLVHQNCSIADVPAFLELSRDTGVPIVEDCSQAHGATLDGQRVGRFGKLAAFSMQQNKLLACGEGGAVLTSDASLYSLLQQLRANGRRYVETPAPGQMEIEEVGEAIGNNYVLSEFHAAILLDRLGHLEAETQKREENVRYLNSMLADIPGITLLCGGPGVSLPGYHKYTVRLSLGEFNDLDVRSISKALTAELGFAVGLLDEPLNRNRLFNPYSSPRFRPGREIESTYVPHRFELPEAARAARECLVIRHHAFLGSRRHMEHIAEAFAKVQQLSGSLKSSQATRPQPA